jgi:hypothetical protein
MTLLFESHAVLHGRGLYENNGKVLLRLLTTSSSYELLRPAATCQHLNVGVYFSLIMGHHELVI